MSSEIKEIELGSWGNGLFRLVVKQRNVLFISFEEIFEDQYGNPLFSQEINKFMKIKRVSVNQNGEWIYFLYDEKKLKELFRKLAKRGYEFIPNAELKNLFKNSKEARDINVVANIISL